MQVNTFGFVNHVGSDVGIRLQLSHQSFFFRKWEGQESPGTRLIRFLSTVMCVQLTPDNSNLALTRTKIDFPWISFIHLL